MRTRRRTAWALALSLVLHAGLLAWLATRPLRPVPSAEPQTLITFELRETPPEKPAAKPEEKRPPSEAGAQRAPAPKSKAQPGERSGPRVATRPDAQPAPPAEDVPRNGEVAQGEAQGPRLKSLVPSSPRIAGGDEGFATEPSSRGTTITNDGSGPSQGEIAQKQAEEAKGLVDGWIVEDKAELRVANGLVDDYFREMRHALEKGATKPPKDAGPEGSTARNLFNGYLQQLQRFGATGSTSYDGEDVPPGREASSPMAREVQRDLRMAEGERVNQQMASLRELGDSMGGKLMAVVEIRQGNDGAFVDAKLVKTSGNPLFDSFVLATAPSSISLLPPLPSNVAQTHPAGVRSLWSFEGLLEYRKRASEMKTEKAADKAYMAAMGLLSLVTGAPFEETTGDVYLMDVRDPKFRVRASLLRLYD